MAKTRQLTKDEIVVQIKGLDLPEIIEVYREVSETIAQEEKEAEKKLNLIRGKGQTG